MLPATDLKAQYSASAVPCFHLPVACLGKTEVQTLDLAQTFPLSKPYTQSDMSAKPCQHPCLKPIKNNGNKISTFKLLSSHFIKRGNADEKANLEIWNARTKGTYKLVCIQK